MGHLMPSSFMMELYFIVAILSAMAVPEASVASPSSGSSKDALQLLSFKCMDHQETVDLLICNSTPSKPNETSMQASLLILSQTLKLRYASKGVNTKGSVLVSGHGDRASTTPRLKSSPLRPKDLVSGLYEVLYGSSFSIAICNGDQEFITPRSKYLNHCFLYLDHCFFYVHAQCPVGDLDAIDQDLGGVHNFFRLPKVRVP
ncbi:hypothetical protein AMTR_s00047p00207000 [Amborella trichopoda]|uniref:Gnk2-homologous domain-containing protein n=1 Tax=Amborella trichopoda TaxID=13333 RepID=U5D8V7_AMBTC|nr:hypothetical protein AMTR_s00047p00207000 [Amborella trichopoda]